MKILVIGDPHGILPKNLTGIVNKEKPEFIICTGDLGKATLARKRFFDNIKRKQKGLPELENNKIHVKSVHSEVHSSTLDVLNKLSHFKKEIYTLQGNVGIPSKGNKKIKREEEKFNLKLPRTLEHIKKMKKINLVKNRLRLINGLRVGFLEHFTDTSWVKEFKPSDYKEKMKSAKKEINKAKKILNRFGHDLDILVCHGPPYGLLDKVTGKFGAPKSWHGKHAGSKVVLDYIKKYQPRYVLCGHIHEGKGKAKIGKTTVYNVGFSGDYVVVDV